MYGITVFLIVSLLLFFLEIHSTAQYIDKCDQLIMKIGRANQILLISDHISVINWKLDHL